jgi:hypothetical protein
MTERQTDRIQMTDRQMTDDRQRDDRQTDDRQTDDRQTDDRQTDDRQTNRLQTYIFELKVILIKKICKWEGKSEWGELIPLCSLLKLALLTYSTLRGINVTYDNLLMGFNPDLMKSEKNIRINLKY